MIYRKESLSRVSLIWFRYWSSFILHILSVLCNGIVIQTKMSLLPLWLTLVSCRTNSLHLIESLLGHIIHSLDLAYIESFLSALAILSSRLFGSNCSISPDIGDQNDERLQKEQDDRVWLTGDSGEPSSAWSRLLEAPVETCLAPYLLPLPCMLLLLLG